MRITNTMLVNNMIGYIGNNLTKMDKYQMQLATGKKISVPSDDPVIAARALKFRTDVAEVSQYQRNAGDSQAWLETTDTVLSNVGDILQRVRELAVQGGSGTNALGDSQKIAEEVEQMQGQMIRLANTTYAGRYVFSGYQTNRALLNEQTGRFEISVQSTETIKFEIGIGDDINVNTLGGELFNNGTDIDVNASGTFTGIKDITFPITFDGTIPNNSLLISVDGGTDVDIAIPDGTYNDITEIVSGIQFGIDSSAIGPGMVTVSSINNKLVFTSSTLGTDSSIDINSTSTAAQSLEINIGKKGGNVGKIIADFEALLSSLRQGNAEITSNLIADFDTDIDNLLMIRADVGARQNRVELTLNRLESDNINFTKLMSDNEDVDMAETIMNLKNEENVYRSSLAGGARIIVPTLLDFLK